MYIPWLTIYKSSTIINHINMLTIYGWIPHIPHWWKPPSPSDAGFSTLGQSFRGSSPQSAMTTWWVAVAKPWWRSLFKRTYFKLWECMGIYIYIIMYIYNHVYIYSHIYNNVYIYIYVCAKICLYIYIYIYIYILHMWYIIYIYIYIHTYGMWLRLGNNGIGVYTYIIYIYIYMISG